MHAEVRQGGRVCWDTDSRQYGQEKENKMVSTDEEGKDGQVFSSKHSRFLVAVSTQVFSPTATDAPRALYTQETEACIDSVLAT